MFLIYRFLSAFRYNYLPSLVGLIVDLSAWRARRMLRGKVPLGVLVDNTVLGSATTHETAWISTGQKLWGDQLVDTGYAARIPIYSYASEKKAYINTKYLSGIISLFRSGHLRLVSSSELRDEQDRQPSGRFRGYGYYDHNLFAGLNFESIDGYIPRIIVASFFNSPDPAEEQRDRLAYRERADPEYASLVRVLGQKNSQDAWHIRTAEKYGLFCFLTMDFKLIEAIGAQRSSARIKSLKTRVMTPEEFGKYLKLYPISPHLMSYNGASFPVRSDLHWPDEKPRGRRKSRKSSD